MAPLAHPLVGLFSGPVELILSSECPILPPFSFICRGAEVAHAILPRILTFSAPPGYPPYMRASPKASPDEIGVPPVWIVSQFFLLLGFSFVLGPLLLIDLRHLAVFVVRLPTARVLLAVILAADPIASCPFLIE